MITRRGCILKDVAAENMLISRYVMMSNVTV